MNRYKKELLPNGLLRIYDYKCQWELTYKKGKNGKWQPHNLNAQNDSYRHLLTFIN